MNEEKAALVTIGVSLGVPEGYLMGLTAPELRYLCVGRAARIAEDLRSWLDFGADVGKTLDFFNRTGDATASWGLLIGAVRRCGEPKS